MKQQCSKMIQLMYHEPSVDMVQPPPHCTIELLAHEITTIEYLKIYSILLDWNALLIIATTILPIINFDLQHSL